MRNTPEFRFVSHFESSHSTSLWYTPLTWIVSTAPRSDSSLPRPLEESHLPRVLVMEARLISAGFGIQMDHLEMSESLEKVRVRNPARVFREKIVNN